MPRQAALSVENNFRNGLITEASGLNFPENACTETYDCEFNSDGSVNRRLGFDFETGHELKTINRANNAIATYLWKNVTGSGDVAIVVKQVGLTLYFYEISADASFSSGQQSTTVTLTLVSGALAGNAATDECHFCNDNDYLIVTHPHIDPIRVSYNLSTHTATSTPITLKIRDFEGAIADPNAVDTRPTETLASMNVNHKYNLYNQGWNTTNLTAWDTAQTTMPSNADVMWAFKDSSNNFDASSTSIARITAGNTPAPKGHFVLTLSNQDRDTAAGTSGVTATTTGIYRPSVATVYAGRIFYAGTYASGFNSKIFFTQIIESTDQYGFCYQVNDPTSENLFDLLPSDGGVINIKEAGTIYKLCSIPGGLTVHAENGVWFITGSSGLGFTANDYTVQKIALIPTLSHSSFVEVNGYPAWWNQEGIYIMGLQVANTATDTGSISQGRLPQVQSLSDTKIKTFYKDIPLLSKKRAKGIYHYTDNHIRWIYRSEEAADVTDTYEYNRVLNFNVLTGAFYPWTITDSDVKVNAIIVSDTISGNINTNNVVRGADDVVDSSGNQVITFTTTEASTIPFDKYLISFPNAGSYDFTFASKINASYLDWFEYDLVERSFDSYFITGYKLPGGAIRKFQNNWVRVFSQIDDVPVSYKFQGLWDFARVGGGTGRWSSFAQQVEHVDTDYSVASKRMKVRGHGLALQFKVLSVEGEPFHILGWSALQSANQSP